MQRLFSMFPRGLPGVGLLLLRASVAGALLLEHYAYRGSLSTGSQIAAVALSLVITAGYMTPLATIAGTLLQMVVWMQATPVQATSISILLLDAVALVLLGPGAYSVDGYRYARRVVVLPP